MPWLNTIHWLTLDELKLDWMTYFIMFLYIWLRFCIGKTPVYKHLWQDVFIYILYTYTPILRSLHWLPIHHRITFKVLLKFWRTIFSMVKPPNYLTDLISLRCSSYRALQLTLGPRTITRYGDRALSVIAPILWNNLPAHIHNTHSLDQFKTLLKTHLFNS